MSKTRKQGEGEEKAQQEKELHGYMNKKKHILVSHG